MPHPPHVHAVKRKLADGSTREYYYDRRTRRRLDPETLEVVHDAKPSASKYAAGSLGALCAEYRASNDFQALKPSSRAKYQQIMDNLHGYAHLSVAGLRRKHVLQVRDQTAQARGAATANLTVSVLGVLCGFAVDRELIEYSPVHKIKSLATGEWAAWSSASIKAGFDKLTGAPFRAFVLAYYTGQRAGDVAAMKWSDYDGQGVYVVQQKTGIKLYVPAHYELRAYLDGWKAEADSIYMVHKDAGQPFTGEALSNWMHRAKKRASIPETFHGLRKSATARLAEAGCSDREIMAITGHTTADMVTHYTQSADQRRRALAAMGKIETMDRASVRRGTEG